MHPTDLFLVYNVFVGIVSGGGFVYLFTRIRIEDPYRPFIRLLVLGLLVFLVVGPLVDLLIPQFLHVVHALSAILVTVGLYHPLANDLRQDDWAAIILQDPRLVRHPNAWMTPMDDDILELFHSTDLVLTPSIIAYNTGYSREEVNRRLGVLTDHGLMHRVERGKYRITERGEEYLTGGLSE